MERLADAQPRPRAHALHRAPTTPTRSSRRSAATSALGFDELVFHGPGADQARFIEQFSADVLPLLT